MMSCRHVMRSLPTSRCSRTRRLGHADHGWSPGVGACSQPTARRGSATPPEKVLDSALDQFPIVGDQISAVTLTGSGAALVVGISTLAAGLVTCGLGGPVLTVAGVALSLALNGLLFFAAFRMLTDGTVPTRELRPGILSATILWTLLQAVGGAYISHVVKDAGSTCGTFATVIGLLTWLFLGARVAVYSAELNSVLARGLQTRGRFDPLEPADRALRTLAKIEGRSDEQHVAVSFEARDTSESTPRVDRDASRS